MRSEPPLSYGAPYVRRRGSQGGRGGRGGTQHVIQLLASYWCLKHG
jgi:hypothetical protein